MGSNLTIYKRGFIKSTPSVDFPYEKPRIKFIDSEGKETFIKLSTEKNTNPEICVIKGGVKHYITRKHGFNVDYDLANFKSGLAEIANNPQTFDYSVEEITGAINETYFYESCLSSEGMIIGWDRNSKNIKMVDPLTFETTTVIKLDLGSYFSLRMIGLDNNKIAIVFVSTVGVGSGHPVIRILDLNTKTLTVTLGSALTDSTGEKKEGYIYLKTSILNNNKLFIQKTQNKPFFIVNMLDGTYEEYPAMTNGNQQATKPCLDLDGNLASTHEVSSGYAGYATYNLAERTTTIETFQNVTGWSNGGWTSENGIVLKKDTILYGGQSSRVALLSKTDGRMYYIHNNNSSMGFYRMFMLPNGKVFIDYENYSFAEFDLETRVITKKTRAGTASHVGSVLITPVGKVFSFCQDNKIRTMGVNASIQKSLYTPFNSTNNLIRR